MHAMKAEHLRKVYRQRGGGDVVAINDLTFTVEPGEVVAIVGRTGCGKSTFLRILLGLEHPTSGRLLIDEHEPYKSFAKLKGVIGVVFQEDRLLPWRSALQNVTIGLEILGVPKGEQVERARSWLEKLGLSRFEDAYPGELSGGMRQRVALARAFITKPKILLADEAFGHLDEVTAIQLRQDFLDLVRETGSTSLFVTHQLEEALDVGDRTLVFGRPATLLNDVDCRQLDSAGRQEAKASIQGIIGSEEEEVPAPASSGS